MPRKNTLDKLAGFTLIELLVVIAIIAILAAILFPVFARARENARRASCMSNMKQISLGMMMYVQDYDSRFPAWWGYTNGSSPLPWDLALAPYTKSVQVFFCPSDTIHNSSAALSTSNVGYGYNYNWLGVSYLGVPQTLNNQAAIKYPSETLMLGESGKNVTGYVIYVTGTYALQDMHFDGSNFAFTDGHVKWLSTKKVTADYYTPALSLWGNRP
jgi:prepilin-type N-terminal cleavage/methylation domain-containing protein/prepilin-type processing-associated H-X9-DG protein